MSAKQFRDLSYVRVEAASIKPIETASRKQGTPFVRHDKLDAFKSLTIKLDNHAFGRPAYTWQAPDEIFTLYP